MPIGRFSPLFAVRGWLYAACLASTACLIGGLCPQSPQLAATADSSAGHVCRNGCCELIPGLMLNGKHACASMKLDFQRAAATNAMAAPKPRLGGPPVAAYNTLHSRPGATKVIYLDFDGHTTGLPWSSSPITTTAYDIDSNPASFSTQEQANIVEIWQRVSECYSPWDVDVTTEAPSVADLINSGGGDTKWGMRVLFGTSTPDPTNGQGGGVAFLFSFGDSNAAGEDVVCFVLQQGVGTGPKYNADAAVHEVGHTLGLNHDGINTATPQNGNQSAYYQGHGTGKTAWAPHMGVGYYVPIVQFSKGQYFDANNLEDDLQIIPQVGGFGIRPDDFANTQTAAKAIPGTAGASSFAVNVNGVIETPSDTDWFKITTGAGALKLDAVGGPANTMLDIELSLYDSKGVLVVKVDPTNDVIASINQSVTAGVYYVKIDGVGVGNPTSTTPTGYSDYGSLGQYNITGSFSTKGLKGAPVLAKPADLFYGVKQPATPINTILTVADPDNTTLVSATVKIQNPVINQDVLSLATNAATMGNITASYDNTTGTLTLNSANATATLAQFQTALRAVSYSNTSSNPSNTPRKIDFQVNDGTITSNIITSTVTIGYYYVTAAYNSGTKTLTIADDGGNNAVVITQRGQQVTVEGAGATRIGNSSSSKQLATFPYSGDMKIVCNMTAGNDSVSIVSMKSSSVILNLGEGNDSASFTYCTIGTLTVAGGNGTDTLGLVGTSVSGAKTVTSVP